MPTRPSATVNATWIGRPGFLFLTWSLLVLAARQASAQTEVTVTVDCAKSEGTLRRPERFNDDSLLRPPPRAVGEKMLAELGLNAIHRSWLYVHGYWDPEKDAYQFDFPISFAKPSGQTYYQYLDQAASMGEQLLIELHSPPIVQRVLAGEIPMARFREAIKRGIVHYRQRCKKLRYIAAFPEVVPTVGQYYELYRQVYSVVNEVNAELGLGRDEELLIGGPTPSSYSLRIKTFIEHCARDSDPKKRLDFVAFHDYTGHRGNFDRLSHCEAEIKGWLRANGLSDNMPILVTEMGFNYRADLGEKPMDILHEAVIQAAGMSSLFYVYNRQPGVQAFHWVMQHADPTQGRKTQMLDDLAWTPYGCSLKMQKMHRPLKVSATTVLTDEKKGRGVYSIASRDDSSVAVQLWNYQHHGTSRYEVTVRIANPPKPLVGRRVRIKKYLIDSAHSNVYYDKRQRDLQLVEERLAAYEAPFETRVALEPNALWLLELSPAPSRP